MQKLTEEQNKQIKQVADKYYQSNLRASSLVGLLKAYYSDDGLPKSKTLDAVELEVITDMILEELSPMQSFLGEVGCGADYILEERA